jgi:hypothetical protein
MDKQRLQKLAGIITEAHTPDMFGGFAPGDLDPEMVDPIVNYIVRLWDASDVKIEKIFAELKRRTMEELQRVEVDDDNEFIRPSGSKTAKRLGMRSRQAGPPDGDF